MSDTKQGSRKAPRTHQAHWKDNTITAERDALATALTQAVKIMQEYADLPDDAGRVAAPDSLVRRRIREAHALLAKLETK